MVKMNRRVRLSIFFLIAATGYASQAVPSVPDSLPSSQPADTTVVTIPETLPQLHLTQVELGPQLVPSTDRLFFDMLLPGESRVLFMELANRGSVSIVLDSLVLPEGSVNVNLALQTLSAGQFIRFPITYTQTDLKSHELEIGIRWNSPEFEVVDISIITLSATPKQPVRTAQSEVIWQRGYIGSRNTAQLTLQNIGTLPVTFPEPPEVPAGVRLSSLPQVLAGETSVIIDVIWLPETSGKFNSSIYLTYQVDFSDGVLEVPLLGEAVQPAFFLDDTLTFGRVYAGSSYRQLAGVSSELDQVIVLSTPTPLEHEGREVIEYDGFRTSVNWLEIGSDLEVFAGSTANLEVVLTPQAAGSYLATVPITQHWKFDQDRDSGQLAELVLNVEAEVLLPLTITADSIDFGPQFVMELTTKSLTVTNNGEVSLSIQPELDSGEKAFSFPPLVFNLNPGDSTEIPVYFRPSDIRDYADVLILRYNTISADPRQVFSELQALEIPLSGSGLDQPLLRLDTIPDVAIDEDLPGPFQIVNLTEIFADANNRISYSIYSPFERNVELTTAVDGWLTASLAPDYHGSGEVVIEAVNELGHVVADTFGVTINPVNDLPRLVEPLRDLVLQEDTAPFVIGRLSEIFIDPDRTLDSVLTQYTIYSPPDDTVRLDQEGEDLLLTIAPDWHGSRSFVVSARDADDTTVVTFDAFKVTVMPVNDPPALANLPEFHLVEDEAAYIDWAPYVHDVDNKDEDLILEFSKAGSGNLSVAFNNKGLTSIVYPESDWFGEVFARVTVTDPAGASVSRDFTLVIESENDPPGSFKGIKPVSREWDQRLRYMGPDTVMVFEWTASPNLDPGDVVTYTWQLMDTTGERILQELPAGPFTNVTAQVDTPGVYLWSVLARDDYGTTTASDTLKIILESTDLTADASEGPLAFAFGPNYPNPFNSNTHISYSIPEYSDVIITVYDAMGREVKVLHSEPQYKGSYEVRWDGRDSAGQQVASGPYVAEIRAGVNTAYLKITVIH